MSKTSFSPSYTGQVAYLKDIYQSSLTNLDLYRNHVRRKILQSISIGKTRPSIEMSSRGMIVESPTNIPIPLIERSAPRTMFGALEPLCMNSSHIRALVSCLPA